ncbi:MAG TPA: hypothetical protein VFH80_24600 [Solirubrobacteraceae bacterium]|nr:hypothetical protein [Solirubrobacteraceae bacterium]
MPDHDRDPTVDHLLMQRIEAVEDNLTERLHDQSRAFGSRLDGLEHTLRDIQKQTRLTNGRVNTLENDKARGQGMISAFRWLPPLLTAIVTAGLTVMIWAITGGVH